MKCIQHSIGHFRFLRYCQRTTGHNNHHHRFTRSFQRFQHLSLSTRKTYIRATTCLSRQNSLFTCKEQDYIRFYGSSNSFLNTILTLITTVSQALLCYHLHIFPTQLFNCCKRSYGVFRLCIKAPCAHLICLSIGKRTYNSNRFNGILYRKYAIILQ